MSKYVVTREQRCIIAKMVEELIAKAEAHYGVAIEIPLITYEAKGKTVAGWARGCDWHVNFHAGFVSTFFDDYIQKTVAHEVAHLIDYRFNPETRESWDYTNMVRKKRSIHGPTWKHIMRAIFKTEPGSTHNWNLEAGTTTDETPRKRVCKSPYVYKCSVCSATMNLGGKRHAKLQRGIMYSHRGCSGSSLVFVRKQGAKKAKKRSTPTARNGSSKADKAAKLLTMHNDKSRGELIMLLMESLDMSKAGATTYYYKYK